MNAKDAELRRSVAPYRTLKEPRAPMASPAQRLRIERLERERTNMDLTSQLMGDPPPSRRVAFSATKRDDLGCYVPQYDDDDAPRDWGIPRPNGR